MAPSEEGEGVAEEFNLWYLGVLIMILGAFLQALGANLQQRSVVREAAMHPNPSERRPTRRQPMFIVGVILLVSAGEYWSHRLTAEHFFV